MDFVTVSTGLILPYWMGLPIRYIQHSVNRILRGLREEHVIRTLYNKIMVLDVEYLKQFVDVKVDA